MNISFLGDVYDHWKGAVFGHLTQRGVLQGLAVDPMLTDPHEWSPQDLTTYASVLRISPEQIIRHESLLTTRHAYFGEIGHTGDLFCDPDVGIAPKHPGAPAKYLYPDELRPFLSRRERVIAVYQHVSRIAARQRLEITVGWLKACHLSFACCSYESANASILFFSESDHRIETIRNSFEELLGRHARTRVGFWRVVARH